ncbi:Clp amino terminal domain-containing protein, pathogenicity island component [Nocardiopsis flavescens]|uniref:Clp amino terminal domain-containing protein, pathogenicity island component n=1 Tax=Nocardiopsis flavescens TaxID=758803 RepID=A0A1M6AXU0_9ACTN|nr:Clp protease N-terminal domain-containing protein [Nocardiopsis flavescens]SHI41260.1 Clp amino terminal domain-containing protein, pathogenicity island component [Nocardiopsis flavescens]
MFERFSRTARAVVSDAVATAAEQGDAKVGPAHLLLTLARSEGAGARILADAGITPAMLADPPAGPAGLNDRELHALRAVGIDTDALFRRLEEAFGPQGLAPPERPAPVRRRGRLGSPFDARAKKVLELSLRETIAAGHDAIDSAHLLLALLRQGLPEPAASVLASRGLTHAEVLRRTRALLDRAA